MIDLGADLDATLAEWGEPARFPQPDPAPAVDAAVLWRPAEQAAEVRGVRGDLARVWVRAAALVDGDGAALVPARGAQVVRDPDGAAEAGRVVAVARVGGWWRLDVAAAARPGGEGRR